MVWYGTVFSLKEVWPFSSSKDIFNSPGNTPKGPKYAPRKSYISNLFLLPHILILL